jgi:hypothetical protein
MLRNATSKAGPNLFYDAGEADVQDYYLFSLSTDSICREFS